MGLNFKFASANIWGIQYHPEITYEKMISIIKFRKDALIEKRNRFKDEEEVNNHIKFIEDEIMISLHDKMKKINGYEESEIANKRKSLEDVLIPEAIESHYERLRNAGFRRSYTWLKCMNFISIIAIK